MSGCRAVVVHAHRVVAVGEVLASWIERAMNGMSGQTK